jgi:NAD(P)-dependent dehydrogenase (short-subunit alcohol dehydrogenase family)
MNKERGVAIITEAAPGIGRRIAEQLAQRGYNLALNNLRTPAETRSAAEKSGAEVAEFLGDHSDVYDVARVANLVQKKWGHSDVLVNNAGVSFISPAEQVPAEPKPYMQVLEGRCINGTRC